MLRGTFLLSNVSYNVMIILLMLVFMHVIPTCNNLVASTWVQSVWRICVTAYADINIPSPPDGLGATATPAEQGARRQCGRGLVGETVAATDSKQA